MMNKEFNKPKNVKDIGETFEEHLARKSKVAKKISNTTHGVTKQRESGSENRGFLSPQVEQNLERYQDKQQKAQILQVWSMLMQAFGSKFTYFFGDEPDSRFMSFAASLSHDGYKRLEANLYERLDENQEWPPSLVRLSQLADSPTKEMMYQARQKLFHNPVPSCELNRVELYIRRYKMSEVRNFSDRFFEAEFNRRYTQWFREVMLDDLDTQVEARQKTLSDNINTFTSTEHDRRREEKVTNGEAFDHPLGERIKDLIDSKSNSWEALSSEQEELVQKIRRATEGQ